MKVTLNLDEKVVMAAKMAALARTKPGARVSLGDLVEEGLRLVLARKKPRDKGGTA